MRVWFQKREAYIVLGLALTFCIVYGLTEGQDVNWDLRNYHLYNVYALLHGRLDLDVAPAQLQTWTNPLGSLLAYFVVLHIKPIIGSVILSSLSALNIWMIYLIARNVFRPLSAHNGYAARWLVILAIVPAALGPVFMSVIGTTFNDNFVAFCILTSLYFSLKLDLRTRNYVFAGAFLGLAAAIKLTAAIYIAGYAVAVILVNPKGFYRQALASMAGFLMAFMPLGGLWMLYIYHRFGNPVFPLYNDIFRSPYFDPVAMKDNRYIFEGVEDFFEKPIELATGIHPGIETFMLDSRYLLFLVILLLCLPILIDALILRRKGYFSPAPVFERTSLVFVLAFIVVNFAFWGVMFGIMRYAIALEQLVPLCIIMLFALMAAEWRRLVLLSIASSLVMSLSVNAGNWGREPFGDDWFRFKFPEVVTQPNTLFVMLTGQGMSYLVPYLPQSDRFVRLSGNFVISEETGLGQKISETISHHDGQIRTLSDIRVDASESASYLAEYGLVLHETTCLPVLTNTEDDLQSCLLTKADPQTDSEE